MKRLAILGHPVDQALSPVLHRAAYQRLGLDWTYHAIDCTAERLPKLFRSLDPTWAGFSLTMPLKRAAVPLLDVISPLVETTGAANTITIEDGCLIGENTDVHGMLCSLNEAGLHHVETATVLGCGATATTALAALHALGCTHVAVVARDRSHAQPLMRAAARIGLIPTLVDWPPADDVLDCDLVISALPPAVADSATGFFPNRPGQTVLDVVYAGWPTPFARAAGRRGATLAHPLTMLVAQAARQLELQTSGLTAPTETMRQAALTSMNTDHRSSGARGPR